MTFGSVAFSQQLTRDVRYIDNGHPRQVLDVYIPEAKVERRELSSLPVMFWIHGGGWQTGDKGDVGQKPAFFTERGFVFVSINYRLLPEVNMEALVGDVASAFGWVHRNIVKYGGDPKRVFVGGHSAGAQLAALICTDLRYLDRHGVPPGVLRGCVPVDGDTYDLPKIITTAELRQSLYGGEMFTFGHRQKFGNDPQKHVEFSAVTHVSKEKPIPPFLIFYFSGNPDTRAQAKRLADVLKNADVPVTVFGKGDTNHRQLNHDLGTQDEVATAELITFLKDALNEDAQ
ncbi:alpha/beta hydrolase [Rhodopirellula sp.]|nr:alpha/beta hydrolase [Rhodopirellula sp.]MDB4678851.1 alpha/beta hydrolase [Rhodopirellula sp.]